MFVMLITYITQIFQDNTVKLLQTEKCSLIQINLLDSKINADQYHSLHKVNNYFNSFLIYFYTIFKDAIGGNDGIKMPSVAGDDTF